MALPYTLDVPAISVSSGLGIWIGSVPAAAVTGSSATSVTITLQSGGALDIDLDAGDFTGELEGARLKLQNSDGSTTYATIEQTDTTDPYAYTLPSSEASSLLSGLAPSGTLRLLFEATEVFADPEPLAVALTLAKPSDPILPWRVSLAAQSSSATTRAWTGTVPSHRLVGAPGNAAITVRVDTFNDTFFINIDPLNTRDWLAVIEDGLMRVQNADGSTTFFETILGQAAAEPYTVDISGAEADALIAYTGSLVLFFQQPGEEAKPLGIALEIGVPRHGGYDVDAVPIGLALGTPDTAAQEAGELGIALELARPVSSFVSPLPLGAALALGSPISPTTAYADRLDAALGLPSFAAEYRNIRPGHAPVALALGQPGQAGILTPVEDAAAQLALSTPNVGYRNIRPYDLSAGLAPGRPTGPYLPTVTLPIGLSLTVPITLHRGRPEAAPIGLTLARPRPVWDRAPEALPISLVLPEPAGLGDVRPLPLAVALGIDARMDARLVATALTPKITLPGLLGYSLSVLLHPRALMPALELVRFDARFPHAAPVPLSVALDVDAHVANAILLRPFPFTTRLFLARPSGQYRSVRPGEIEVGLHLKVGRQHAGISWPESLPQAFLAAGFNAELADHVRRHGGTDGGLRSPRYTEGVDLIRGRMNMTRAQYDTFFAFYDQTLRRGTRPFYMPAALDDGTLSLVEFDDLPGRNRTGGVWEVSLSLRVIG